MEVLYLSPSRMLTPPSSVSWLQLRSRLSMSLLSLRRSRTAPLLSSPSRLEERFTSVISLSREIAWVAEVVQTVAIFTYTASGICNPTHTFSRVTAPSSSIRLRERLSVTR